VVEFIKMTLRQKLTASKIIETNGNVSKAMILAGYPKTTARNPQQITRSKAWPDLMEKYFPDTLLSKQHKKLLVKNEFIAVGEKGDRHIEPTGEIDPQAVARALDMAYKLKNKYPATAVDVSGAVAVVNVVDYAKAPIEAEVVE